MHIHTRYFTDRQFHDTSVNTRTNKGICHSGKFLILLWDADANSCPEATTTKSKYSIAKIINSFKFEASSSFDVRSKAFYYKKQSWTIQFYSKTMGRMNININKKTNHENKKKDSIADTFHITEFTSYAVMNSTGKWARLFETPATHKYGFWASGPQ